MNDPSAESPVDDPRIVKRHPGNPVLSASDLSYPSTLVFNAGVAKYGGRYVMVFRNDYGGKPGTAKFQTS